MLVILEGGYVFLQFLNNLLFLRSSFKSFSFVINCSYNLRSISSSATSVMKVKSLFQNLCMFKEETYVYS